MKPVTIAINGPAKAVESAESAEQEERNEMAVPKKRKSASKRDMRRAHWKLETPSLAECSRCHALIVPHRVCPECGYYNGRQVLKVKEK